MRYLILPPQEINQELILTVPDKVAHHLRSAAGKGSKRGWFKHQNKLLVTWNWSWRPFSSTGCLQSKRPFYNLGHEHPSTSGTLFTRICPEEIGEKFPRHSRPIKWNRMFMIIVASFILIEDKLLYIYIWMIHWSCCEANMTRGVKLIHFEKSLREISLLACLQHPSLASQFHLIIRTSVRDFFFFFSNTNFSS